MKVIRDDLWLCRDCTIVAVNGDYSGVESSHYSPFMAPEVRVQERDKRIARIDAGLEELGPHLVPDWDSESEDDDNGILDFAHIGCDCCRSGLAGEFHRFAVLGPDDA